MVDELRDELQEAYDNMPSGLQEGLVGEARLEAASQLEDISSGQPQVPPCVASLRVVHYPPLRQDSRGDRADAAVQMLQAAIEAIRCYQGGGGKLSKADLKLLAEFIEQLEDHAAELETVEFPGMFG